MKAAGKTTNRTTVTNIKPRLLSIRDSAAYGATSRSTLYAEEKAGRIKFVKMGACTRIEVSELDRWIDQKVNEQNAV